MAVQPLCRYLAQDPQDRATSASRKSTLYIVAARVAQVAIVLLTASVCAVGLGLLAVPPFWLALIAIGGVIALTPLASKCQVLSREHRQIADFEQKVVDEIDIVSKWSQEDLNTFYSKNEIQLLKDQRDLTRLIARFNAYEKVIEGYKNNFETLYQDNSDPIIEHANRTKAWELLEEGIFPLKLESAILLQSMIEPTKNLELAKICTVTQKTFDLRNMDLRLEQDEVYLTKDRDSLNVHQMNEITIPELRKALFGELPSISEESTPEVE